MGAAADSERWRNQNCVDNDWSDKMKLLILHLSDMHFRMKDSYQRVNVDAISAALQQSIQGIQYILILISGDLAFSGKKEECIQVRKFLNELKKSIQERYKISYIEIACVPGNHDVNYDKGDYKAKGLAEIEKSGKYKENITEELRKQSEFLFLAKLFGCLEDGGLVNKKTLTYEDKVLQINLVNSAAFSSLDNDQGYHFLPEEEIEKLKEHNNSDYVFTVMHHPHHWYSMRCKKQLEKALFSSSDIIYVGHEHYESTQKVMDEKSTVNIFAAGMLSNQGDWSESEFHIGILELETRRYVSKKYCWNKKHSIYEDKNGDIEIRLSQNRFKSMGLSADQEYEKAFYEDKYQISENFLDYFVFPRLIVEQITEDNNIQTEEIINIETFLARMQSKHKIVISGQKNSGKTALTRAIYKEISKEYITLFIDGKSFTGNNEKTVRDAFEQEFSRDPSQYQSFLQCRSDDLIVIVDDIDAIVDKKQEDFIEFLLERFGKVIMTCQSDIDVDIKSRLRKRASAEDSLMLRIARYYTDKREELITSVVNLIIEGEEESRAKIVRTLCGALSGLKSMYGWNPDFLVQFTKHYCKMIGEVSNNDGNVFNKVFEYNLISLIKPYAKKNLTVDKILVVIDKIALYI